MIKTIQANIFYLDQITAVHLLSFPNFFLTFLGPTFLKIMYSGFINDKTNAITLVAVDTEKEEKVIGFIAGSTKPKEFFKILLRKNWPRFGLAVLMRCINQPSTIKKIYHNVKMRLKNDAYSVDGAELSSIAVLPEYQNKHVGKQLIDAFLKELNKRGIRSVYLTTDKFNNDKVNSFYLRNGWSLEKSFVTPLGREMNLYTKEID
ncbi:MAG: GNAT family N-acetyltransferase [Candidatus Omnitrophica bacterium]|nr:GNAT family N-acetyltransferase [Candidatus Omnitrophota bacterium]